MPDGALAGSTATLYRCMLNVIAYGINKEEAIRAATIIPAKEVGCEKDLGSITQGKLADFIVISDDYFKCPEEAIKDIKVLRTVIGGKTVWEK